MNITTNCENCNEVVLLTSSYRGQPIICIPCGKKIKEQGLYIKEV